MAEKYYAVDIKNPRQWLMGGDAIKQNIKCLIMTKPYEIPMSLVESPVPGYLDKPLSETKLDIIRDVSDVINTWETRVKVKSVVPVIKESQISIGLTYVDLATNDTTTVNI